MKLLFKVCALGLILAATTACQKRIQRPGPEVAMSGSYLMHRGKRFTGIVETYLEAVNVRRETPYRNGLIDGAEEEYAANGQLVARRIYSANVKTGVHETWFEDGRRSSHIEYSKGEYDGESWEWHRSGALAMYARFEKGRCLGKKRWREDGSIYMNYVFPEGRAVGLPGAKLCLQVRGGA
jgi:antitoxin component YwqK of YwqJK toxin-antitoxin module